MKTIHLLRHALVEKKYQKCYNGWFNPDIEPIKTEKIKELQEKIESLDIKHFISSDLTRCIQTFRSLDIHDFITDARVREFRFKDFIDGKRYEEFQHLTKPEHMETMDSWINFIKGEEPDDFKFRIENFLQDVKNNTLVCTHQGSMNMFISIIQNKNFGELFKTKIDNLDLITLEILPQ